MLLLPEAACWHLRATKEKKKKKSVWSGDMSNTCACINGRAVRDPALAVSEAEEGAGRGTLALVGDLAHSAAASVASLTRDAMLGRPGGYRHGAPPARVNIICARMNCITTTVLAFELTPRPRALVVTSEKYISPDFACLAVT